MAQQATTLANQQTASSKQTAANQQKSGTQPNIGSRYFGALVLVGVILPVPMLATLLTVVIYILPKTSLNRIDPFQLGAPMIALLLGFIITFFVWLLLAFFCTPFATAAGGRQLSYDSIKIELGVLKARQEIVKGVDTYTTLTEQQRVALTEEEKARCIALADIDENLRLIEQMLQSKGLQWVLSTGYTTVWKLIYNAKEVMICLLPPTIVIDDAKYDESRLQGSDIPDHDSLLTVLENAIVTLSPPALPQIQSSPTQTLLLPLPQQTETQARTDIRKVSYVIHKFTSERWEGLLRLRNQLMGTALLAGIFTYVLFAIAILANIPQDQIEHVIVFYFLGAIVGLFARLNTESNQTDAAIDDYGLTMARVLVAPLLSGLAALVGVFLLPIVFGLTTSSGTHGLNISAIYDFTTYNLVFAAIFGFVPNLVINVLQQKSEDVKSEIKSSSAADTSTGRGGAAKGSRGTGSSGKNQMGTGPLSSLTGQLGTGLLPAGLAPGQANGGGAGPLDGGSASVQPSPAGPAPGQAKSDGAGPLDGGPASG